MWSNKVKWTIFSFTIKILTQLIYLICGYIKPGLHLLPYSLFLNVYCIPKELDYPNKNLYYKNSIRIDNFLSTNPESTNTKQCLKNFIMDHKDDKLIYLSLGTIANNDREVMKSILKILSNSEYFIIVSTGNFKYCVSNNMYADSSIDQIYVLKHVNLFITHGGNNSVTEAMAFGVPMIVLQIWLDGVNNAERIEENGFGFKIKKEDIENNLVITIDKVFADPNIIERSKSACERIRSTNFLETLATLFENL